MVIALGYAHPVPPEGQLGDAMNLDQKDLRTSNDLFIVKSYVLNQDDHFVWFSPEWDLEFQALLTKDYEVKNYLGHSFLDLLADPSMRLLYRSLFAMVRRPESKQLSLTMRCDRLPFKILMSQDFKCEADGHIKVQLAYLSCEPMGQTIPSRLWSDDSPLKMCSWCQSIFDNEQAVWLPLEEALGHLSLLHETELPNLSHGCCSVCLQLIRGKVHEYSRR